MGKLLASLTFLAALCSPLEAKIVTEPVSYSDSHGTPLHGFVLYDDSLTGKRPGIVVIHDWRGVTDTTKRRCEMLAALGYVAFAADIYGKDVQDGGVKAWGHEAYTYKSNRPLFRDRAKAAFNTLAERPETDATRMAAIGYCFGGTGVIEMVRDGLPLKGVVSFHGGLDAAPLSSGAMMQAKVLALCGADDPSIKPEDMQAFEQQLKDNHVDYEIVSYGGAVHAFTDPGVDALNLPGAKYNAAADRRSWQAMRDFFAEIFGQ